MPATLPLRLSVGRFLSSAIIVVAICFCINLAAGRASASPVVYTFEENQPFFSPFIVTGNITVDSGILTDGALSFSSGPDIPLSSWFQPSWNGSYLSAGIFGTSVGTVLATGPGTPGVQIFNSQSGRGTVSGSWVVVPEPSVISLVLVAGFGLKVMTMRPRRF